MRTPLWVSFVETNRGWPWREKVKTQTLTPAGVLVGPAVVDGLG
jgi:hypothetical protein